MPLIDLPKVPSYPITMELDWIVAAKGDIMKYIAIGFVEPNEILKRFRQYSFLMEKSVGNVTKTLFGEQKESPLVKDIDPTLVDAKIEDYFVAKRDIEKQCIDSMNCHFFSVQTKQAKMDLVSRADEYVQSILTRLDTICFDNLEVCYRTPPPPRLTSLMATAHPADVRDNLREAAQRACKRV